MIVGMLFIAVWSRSNLLVSYARERWCKSTHRNQMPAYSIKEMGQTVNLLSYDSPGSLPGAGTIFYKIILDNWIKMLYNINN